VVAETVVEIPPPLRAVLVVAALDRVDTAPLCLGSLEDVRILPVFLVLDLVLVVHVRRWQL
jgi:hypothetical protein